MRIIAHSGSACGPEPAYGSDRIPDRSAVARRLWHMALALGLALKVRRERRLLLRLDDHALKDMGLNRGTAHNEAQRPFWDIPADRMRR